MRVNGSPKEMNLNLSDFSSGIYLVKVQSGETTQTVRIVNM